MVVFEYLYRDAANYKAFGALKLDGILRDGDQAAFQETLHDREFFVAEQVGVPTLYHRLYQVSGGPTNDDHGWHSIFTLREATEDEHSEPDTVWGSVDNLLEAFRSVETWQPKPLQQLHVCG